MHRNLSSILRREAHLSVFLIQVVAYIRGIEATVAGGILHATAPTRHRSIQSVIPTYLPRADAGLPCSRRAARCYSARPNLGGLSGESVPQRAHHRGASHWHPAVLSPGDPAVSRDRVGE